MDMTNAGMGIAVLRHSLTNNAPLEALKEVSAVMNSADGGCNCCKCATNNHN